ncbi:hypothetical protein [Streptomyces sp. N35]|uniref:hypothetical protein n=1 Tax=Streptomyces sp. N35 TaxID=2795730 RepID=UPI0018F718F0|nr:hypothetical protein [Streptomyces sp. N35]
MGNTSFTNQQDLYDDLEVTVRLSGRAAHHVRRRAEVTGMSLETVTAEAVGDEFRRRTYDSLYAIRVNHAARIEGLAGRLAKMMLELGGLPRTDVGAALALATDMFGDELHDDVRARQVAQMASLYADYGTAFGERPDGSYGPVEETKVRFSVTPEQYDALRRIGYPGNDADAQILDLALHQLDPDPELRATPEARWATLTLWRTEGDSLWRGRCLDFEIAERTASTPQAVIDELRESIRELVQADSHVLDHWATTDTVRVPKGDSILRLAVLLTKVEQDGSWEAYEPITGCRARHAQRDAVLADLATAVGQCSGLEEIVEARVRPVDVVYPEDYLARQEADRAARRNMSEDERRAELARWYKNAERPRAETW